MTQAKKLGGVLPLMGSIVFVFLLFLSTVPAISATFTDTFDNPAFTNSNWMDFPTGADQTWRFTTLSAGDTGYHATTAAPGPGLTAVCIHLRPGIGPDDTLYVGSGIDLLAISPAGTGTGRIDPALDASGNLYLGGRVNDLWSTHAMFALDPSGNLLWTYQLPQTDYIGKSSPLVDKNGVVYFGTTDHLFALPPQGGGFS